MPFVIIVHANGKTVLGQDPVARLFDILDNIRSLDSFVSACNDDDVEHNNCEGLGAVQFWNSSSASVFRDEVGSDDEVIQAMSASTFPNLFPVPENDIFGFPRRNTTSNLLTSVTSYTITMKIPAEVYDPLYRLLVEDALDATLKLRDVWASDPDNDLNIEAIAFFSIYNEYV